MSKDRRFTFVALSFLLLLSALTLGAQLTVDPAAPVPANEAAGKMTVPEGFRVTLSAAEPEVVQPIAMTTDDRGRLWVVECNSYPDWTTNKTGKDRVLIFEDRDGDGKFDERKVFLDNGRNLTGIALGFGGVWLCSAPELIFVPDKNRDDKPDGNVEVLLDGWSIETKHNIVNGLIWGPDGWLYGCHGILADSLVGRPGATAAQRTRLNCSVWRFHPVRREFEIVAHGTTNPWGIAFNDVGEMFVANCVIKHLFHVVPGGHYSRMYGQDLNPYAFKLIESAADHIHWAGGHWTTEGRAASHNDAFGGGHAHSGALIYLGHTWPEKYRNSFFTINIHGHRLNNDRLQRRGSGYVAQHADDFVKANDPWFRGVALAPAADGGVYFCDWSDAGECHDYIDIHRENGRIFKVNYGNAPRESFDFAKLKDEQLARLQTHTNDWAAGMARRFLQERAAAGTLGRDGIRALEQIVGESRTAFQHRLRALWSLHAVRATTPALFSKLLQDDAESVRAWAVRLILERDVSPDMLKQMTGFARSEQSSVVRLAYASGLQRLPLPARLDFAIALGSHTEDANDANIPFVTWYGVEPIASTDDEASRKLLTGTSIPLVRELVARRLALRESLDPLAEVLAESNDAGLQRDVIAGMHEALNGRRAVALPANWPEAFRKVKTHADNAVRQKAMMLAAVFNDPAAFKDLEERVGDAKEQPAIRQTALNALVQARAGNAVALLQNSLGDSTLRSTAIRGLAGFENTNTASLMLDRVADWKPDERAEVINTLATRPEWAMALLQAVSSGKLKAREITPFTVRQIQAFKNPELAELIKKTMGDVRPVSADKAKAIASYRGLLSADTLKKANLTEGRATFNRTCAACHKLFDEGGSIGPELTGSQRSNLDYILENVVDPNASVWQQYKATYFETQDDRVISGVVTAENESTVTIQTLTGTVTLPRKDITARNQTNLSMMPEGLFEALSEKEIIDLVAYLQSSGQVTAAQSK